MGANGQPPQFAPGRRTLPRSMSALRILTGVLLAFSLALPTAVQAESGALSPPVVTDAVPYATTVHVAGSADSSSASVQVFAAASCDAARDPSTAHFLGTASPAPDGAWKEDLPLPRAGETFIAAVSSSSGSPSSAPSACFAIRGAPAVSAGGDRSVDERSSSVMVFVTRSSADGESAVDLDTVDGSAHDGSDYWGYHGRLTFARGETEVPVWISVRDNEQPQGTSKTFSVRLSNPSGAAVTPPGSTTYTITGGAPATQPRLIVTGRHRSDFGAVATSDSVGGSTGVVISNAGNTPATITRAVLNGSPAFSTARDGCRPGRTLRGRESCTLLVRFRPKVQGHFTAVLTIESNAPLLRLPFSGTGGRVGYRCTNDAEYPAERDPGNPLMLRSHRPTATDPLTGARFFVDSKEGLGIADLKRLRAKRRFREANLLRRITTQPETKRFSRFTRTGGYRSVRQLMCRVPVQHPGSIPLLSLYRLEHEHCGNHNGDSPGEQRSYRSFVDDFARGVGRFPVVIFYEFDSIITTPCLNARGLATRIAELRYGIKVLSKLPHAVVYLDAGAADALPYRRTANLLNRVGIGPIQGFFLNSTHYDWTRSEIAYGRRISRLVGGKHFVVSTAVNGRGPLRSRNPEREGNTVLCNPPGRGLGKRPTTRTGDGLVDAFAWIGNPGRSGGRCHRGDARNGYWDLRYALSLARHARF